MRRGRAIAAGWSSVFALAGKASPDALDVVPSTWGVSCPHAFSSPPAPGSGDGLLESWPEENRGALLKDGCTRPLPVSSEVAGCGGFLQAAVVFERPPGEVIGLLSQTHRRGEFIDSLHRVESVERGKTHSIDEQEIKVLFTKLRHYMRSEWSAEHGLVSWTLDPNRDHDIDTPDAYWHLHPLTGGRTLGICGNRVSVGGIIPAITRQRLSQKKMNQSLGHIRGWVNSNGTSRPGPNRPRIPRSARAGSTAWGGAPCAPVSSTRTSTKRSSAKRSRPTAVRWGRRPSWRCYRRPRRASAASRTEAGRASHSAPPRAWSAGSSGPGWPA